MQKQERTKKFIEARKNLVEKLQPAHPYLTEVTIGYHIEYSNEDFVQYCIYGETHVIDLNPQITMPCVDYNPKYEVHA